MTTTATYPQFFRFLGHCVKRESDTRTTEVRIPDPKKILPLCHQQFTYDSKESLDKAVERMDKANQEIYESYLSAFFQMSAENARKFNEYRQRKYNSNLIHN